LLNSLHKHTQTVALPAFFSSRSTPATTTAHLIVNAAGLDRLGIVSDVTGLVIQHGGNVGESVAARLGSQYFSLMMLVTVPESAKEALQHDILAVPDLSSAVFTVDAAAATSHKPTPQIGCAYSRL
jgi:glycine cleavage system transcriptional repressor